MILKYLSESLDHKKVVGTFLISTPFWSGDEDWKEDLKLFKNFADRMPENLPVFFYHCEDDEEVPINHLELYKQNLPGAIVRKLPKGGHQMNNDLQIVARDIKSI